MDRPSPLTPSAHRRGRAAPPASSDRASFLTVIRFAQVAEALAWERSLARRLTLDDTVVLDAAILHWDEPHTAPRSRHLTNIALRSSAVPTLWSLVLGLTVNLGLLGQEAPLSVLEPVGVPAELLSKLRKSLRPGAAAIFLLTGNPLDDALLDSPAVVVHRAALTARQHARLQQVFCP